MKKFGSYIAYCIRLVPSNVCVNMVFQTVIPMLIAYHHQYAETTTEVVSTCASLHLSNRLTFLLLMIGYAALGTVAYAHAL